MQDEVSPCYIRHQDEENIEHIVMQCVAAGETRCSSITASTEAGDASSQRQHRHDGAPSPHRRRVATTSQHRRKLAMLHCSANTARRCSITTPAARPSFHHITGGTTNGDCCGEVGWSNTAIATPVAPPSQQKARCHGRRHRSAAVPLEVATTLSGRGGGRKRGRL